MNLVWSIGFPERSLMLVTKMWTYRILPSNMESPHGILEVLCVAGTVGIYSALSTKSSAPQSSDQLRPHCVLRSYDRIHRFFH